MQKKSRIQSKGTRETKTIIRVKGEIQVNFYSISSDNLDELNVLTTDSDTLGIAFCFFSISMGFFAVLITTFIRDRLAFSALFGAASVFLAISCIKYKEHRKNRKRISEIVEKVKENVLDPSQ